MQRSSHVILRSVLLAATGVLVAQAAWADPLPVPLLAAAPPAAPSATASAASSPPDATASAVVLTLDALVDRVLAGHAELKVAALGVESAQAGVATAQALPNPRVDWQTGRFRPMVGGTSSGATGDTMAVTVAQPLENPWLRQARRAAAQAGVDVAREQRSLVRNEVSAKARTLVAELILRQREVEVYAEARQLLEQVRDRTRRRVELGEAARYDLIKADAELITARQKLQQAALLVDQVKLSLNRLAGGGLPALWVLSPETVAASADMPSADPGDPGVDGNPELRMLSQVVRQSGALVSQARSSVLPSVELQMSRSREPDGRQSTMGLSLSVPLLDRRQGPISQAQVELLKAQASLDGRRAELLQEVQIARKALEMAQTRVRALSQGALAEAEAAVRVAEAAWRFGERGILDVLDAQRVLRTLRADLIQARFEAQSALVEIERLEGRHAQARP